MCALGAWPGPRAYLDKVAKIIFLASAGNRNAVVQLIACHYHELIFKNIALNVLIIFNFL